MVVSIFQLETTCQLWPGGPPPGGPPGGPPASPPGGAPREAIGPPGKSPDGGCLPGAMGDGFEGK